MAEDVGPEHSLLAKNTEHAGGRRCRLARHRLNIGIDEQAGGVKARQFLVNLGQRNQRRAAQQHGVFGKVGRPELIAGSRLGQQIGVGAHRQRAQGVEQAAPEICALVAHTLISRIAGEETENGFPCRRVRPLGKDGERNDFGFTADYRLTDLDRISLRARALRIDEDLPDNETWSHSYDAYYSHLFPINARWDLFAEGSVGVDFVYYDDPSTSSLHLGEDRKDTILTWGLGGGAVLDDVWTGRIGYYRYDLDSNFDEKDKDDNRVFLTLRRAF